MEAHTVDLRHLIRRCPECRQLYSPDSVFCPFDGARLEPAPFDPHADALIGQTVDGRYEVARVLGEGGMGTVYEVKHASLGRGFAMKVLRRDLAEDAELCARFTQEAKATAAVKHPNIVGISDFGKVQDGRPYFVMELLVGRTLATVLKAQGPVEPVRGAGIVAKVASGLGAAHAAGVVHRDLKPENVFLPDGGVQDDVRVVDFGAAMLAGASRLTKAGIVFGTPHYMSPEQAAGQRVDHRADVYSLGIIMYEMFSGRVPFEGDTYMGVLTQHIYTQPAPPSQFVPGGVRTLGAIEAVILRAIEKNPEDRFQSMHELEVAIASAVRSAADGGAAVAAWKPPSQRPSQGPAPSGPTLEQLRDAVTEAAGPPAPRARARGLVLVVLAVLAVAVGILVVVAIRKRPMAPGAPVAPVASVLVGRASSVPSGAVSGVSGGGAFGVPSASGLATPPVKASAPPVSTSASPPAKASAPPARTSASPPKPTGRPVPRPARAPASSHGAGEFADPWK